jgi:hypothetical protein
MKWPMYDFDERLAFSEGVEFDFDAVLTRLMEVIPNAIGYRRAEAGDDLKGTDYWIDRAGDLRSISIDWKHRGFCPVERFGSDDACIEVVSVYEGRLGTNNYRPEEWPRKQWKKPGWSVDRDKATDWVVYTWPTPEGKRRYWMVYFPHLCTVAREYWGNWWRTYGVRTAINDGYVTLSVYPLRSVIKSAISDLVEGSV